MNSNPDEKSEGFQRVAARLAELNHPHPPQFLSTSARTAQEAADVLGVSLGQIATWFATVLSHLQHRSG
jgi:hypothetical protein